MTLNSDEYEPGGERSQSRPTGKHIGLTQRESDLRELLPERSSSWVAKDEHLKNGDDFNSDDESGERFTSSKSRRVEVGANLTWDRSVNPLGDDENSRAVHREKGTCMVRRIVSEEFASEASNRDVRERSGPEHLSA